MSRPRSPHYAHRMSPRRHEDRGDRSQRFPWDDPNFDPERVLADLDRLPWEDVPEDLKDYLMEEMIHPPEAQRRPARSPGYHRPGPHQLPPEEFHHRSPSPPHEQGYGDPGRHSPKRREGRGDGRRRGGFREDFGRFDERERPPHSPQRLPRERLPSVAQHQADHHRDPSAGWGREEPTRGQGRPRGRGSRERFHDQGRGDGRDRGGGEPLGPFEDRRREDLQRERSPQSVRYEREAQFRERHRSLERNREGFGGGPGERREPWGGFNQREGRGPGPLIVEHDHGMLNSAGPSRREPFEDRRDRGPSRERLHYRAGSSQERFRKSNVREEARGHPIHDALRGPGHEPRRNSPVHHEDRSSPIHHEGRRSPIHHEGRRSPMYHERTSPMGIPPGRDGPMDHRGRGSQGHRGRSSQAHRGRGNSSRGGRMDFGPSRNQPHPQPFPHAPQPHSPQHQRQNVRPREPDWDTDSREEEPGRVQEPHSAPRWEKDRPRGGGRPPLGGRMDPAMPRGRELNPHWNEMRNVNAMAASRAHAVVEETLTIKVDMNRPVGQNSQLCYSSDRQLSLDLVNVGRQRLDFLPMLEHSGTYRENAVHSGTFAQEIITLVHKVKEHYFKGADITLNQRFSGPQEGGLPEEEEEEEEEEEVAEEERPTLNRRFNMNMNMMLPDIKPLFSNMGHMQPHQRQHSMNDPGDLRHDLERRRQERLEEVKVTIPGGSLSQRPLGLGSERNEEYVSEEEAMPLEEDDGGFSGWSGEQTQGGRWDGHMGQRRGDIFRPNMGAPRRNYRPQNRPGNRRNFNGANW